MSYISAAVILFLVMDPFGNLLFINSILKKLPSVEQQKIMVRELFIALAILLLFFFMGPQLLKGINVSNDSLSIAGGIILFLIAIKMVFGHVNQLFDHEEGTAPFIVPIAVPCLAGPSAIATILMLIGQEPTRWKEWLLALFCAWGATFVSILASMRFLKFFKPSVLSALERFMGLLLTAISVEMFLNGLKAYMKG